MTDETQTQNENNSAPSWFIDDGVAGVGERPTWLPERYKSAAELGKAYAELEKKLGSAPEAYDISKSKYLDPEYAPIQEFLDFSKEKRVPKEVIEKMADTFDRYMDEFSIDPEQELKSLGDNAKERLTVLDNWAKANMTDESYQAIKANLRSADAIKAFEELRGKMMSSVPQVPTGNDTSATTVATIDELKIELSTNLGKYKSDPDYRKDYQRRLEIATKNAPGMVDKIGA